MSGFEVDDKGFWTDLKRRNLPPWVEKAARLKIEDIQINPTKSGGRYRGKWAYSLGKYIIVADLDEKRRIIKLLDLVCLP